MPLPPPQPGSPRLLSSWLRWWGSIAASVGVLSLASWVSPGLAISPWSAYGVGFTAVAASSIVVGAACPRVRRRALWLITMPLSVLWMIHDAGGLGLGVAVGVTAALLCAGSLLGAIVGGEVEHAGYLVFVAVVSSAMDMVSVFHPTGPSAVIAVSPRMLSLVALPWPMLGTPNIEAFLGVGDVVFVALYLAACRRHRLPAQRTLAALVLAFAATALAVAVLERAIPALPLLGAAVVGMHPEARRPPAAELVRGALVSSLVVIACVVMLVFRFR